MEDKIVDIPGVGPVTFPGSMSDQEINTAAKRLYDEANQRQETKKPSTSEIVKQAVAPELSTQIIGKLAGLMARSTIQGTSAIPNIIADPFYRMAGITPPAQGVRESLTAIGFPQYAETPIGKISEAGTEALGGAGSQLALASQAAQKAVTQFGKNLAERFAAQPTAQLISAPLAAGTAEETFRRTQDPLVSTLAAMAAGTASGVRPGRIEPFPQKPDLAKRAQNLYDRAESANLRVNQQYSKQIADKLAKEAKDEGFDVGLHPKVSAVLTRLETEGQSAKSLEELERLRRIIKAPEGDFTNPDQQRIAARMLDAYDEMIENLGKSNITSSKEKTALAALQEARKLYGQNKRLGIIEDIVKNAEISSGQYSQSGMDNALRVQFAALAKNDKRMSAFTSEERAQIENIAKGGGTAEQMMRFVGKFAIRGPVTGLVAGAGTAVEPTFAVPAAILAEGGRRGAEAVRRQNISRLMAQISLGRTPESRAFELVPPATMRGLLSTQYEPE